MAAVHAGYRRYRSDLVAAGVRLYERRPSGDKSISKKVIIGSSRASLHAKTYVFDRKSIFIGSMNLDPRSLNLNTEIGVYCESPAIASQVANDLEARLDRIAWRVELRTDPAGKGRLKWIQTDSDGKVTGRSRTGSVCCAADGSLVPRAVSARVATVSNDAARDIQPRVRPCCSMMAASCLVAASIVASLSPE